MRAVPVTPRWRVKGSLNFAYESLELQVYHSLIAWIAGYLEPFSKEIRKLRLQELCDSTCKECICIYKLPYEHSRDVFAVQTQNVNCHWIQSYTCTNCSHKNNEQDLCDHKNNEQDLCEPTYKPGDLASIRFSYGVLDELGTISAVRAAWYSCWR